jgi:hypothetical protein
VATTLFHYQSNLFSDIARSLLFAPSFSANMCRILERVHNCGHYKETTFYCTMKRYNEDDPCEGAGRSTHASTTGTKYGWTGCDKKFKPKREGPKGKLDVIPFCKTMLMLHKRRLHNPRLTRKRMKRKRKIKDWRGQSAGYDEPLYYNGSSKVNCQCLNGIYYPPLCGG